jgi:hypothetical protein
VLPLYDLRHLTFEVARSHVGQYSDGKTVVCVAPLAARKQLAKQIGGRDDVPANWAFCQGERPEPVPPLLCADYFRAATGSDADRAALVEHHRGDGGGNGDDDVAEHDDALLGCLRDWASATLGHDVARISTAARIAALQAAKDALQAWAPLTDESGPLYRRSFYYIYRCQQNITHTVVLLAGLFFL